MGATGFIGGSVLNRLLAHPDASTFTFTALVRSPVKAELLKQVGVESVIGSLKDAPLVEKLATEADIIISTADCDDVDIASSYLRGMKKRYETTGKIPILLHTSGTGTLADESAGYLKDVTIYNDDDPDQIESLADTQQHRLVDLEIVKADKEGYARTYIILPSMIYGIATGRLVDLGIQNKFSIQIPSLVRAALGRGRGGMVGAGTNIWGNVHIQDLVDLYEILFNHIRQNPDTTAHGREGYYFGINGEYNLYQIGKGIAEHLVALGKSSEREPSTFTDEEIKKYFAGSSFWGTNSRGRANRSRSLGWNPLKSTHNLYDGIGLEIDAMLEAGVAQG